MGLFKQKHYRMTDGQTEVSAVPEVFSLLLLDAANIKDILIAREWLWIKTDIIHKGHSLAMYSAV